MKGEKDKWLPPTTLLSIRRYHLHVWCAPRTSLRPGLVFGTNVIPIPAYLIMTTKTSWAPCASFGEKKKMHRVHPILKLKKSNG